MVSIELVSGLSSASLSWTRVQGLWVVVPACEYLCYTQIIFPPSNELLQRKKPDKLTHSLVDYGQVSESGVYL